MFKKIIDLSRPIHHLLQDRWSGCAYDPKRHISYDVLISLLEAVRWAPSCYGDQPWRLVICDKLSNQEAWENALSCMVEGNRAWAQSAPLFILVSADSILSKTGKANRWGEYDTGAAIANLCVQATAFDLMVHQMGGFNAELACQNFAIPEQYTPMSMLSIGYQLAEEQIGDEYKSREYAPRQRHPLSSWCFDGKWQKPVKINE